MSLDQDKIRAERAKQILGDQLVIQAFELMEADFVAAWKSSKGSDAVFREEIYGLQRLMGKFRSYFEAYVAGGKLASARLEIQNNERSASGA